jgi:hypothetical protein
LRQLIPPCEGWRSQFEYAVTGQYNSAAAPDLVPYGPHEHATHRTSAGPKAVRSCRQSGAALLAARTKNSAASASTHTTAKPVLLGTFANVGLVWALHDSSRPCGPRPHRNIELSSCGCLLTSRAGAHQLSSTPHATVLNPPRQHAKQGVEPTPPAPFCRYFLNSLKSPS